VRLHHRLNRLEQRVPDSGCPGCRDRRGRSVLVESERLPDGSVVLWNKEPEACVLCGLVPEFIVKVILSVVGGPNRPEERPSGNEERPWACEVD
jgi:hypothetical protein